MKKQLLISYGLLLTILPLSAAEKEITPTNEMTQKIDSAKAEIQEKLAKAQEEINAKKEKAVSEMEEKSASATKEVASLKDQVSEKKESVQKDIPSTEKMPVLSEEDKDIMEKVDTILTKTAQEVENLLEHVFFPKITQEKIEEQITKGREALNDYHKSMLKIIDDYNNSEAKKFADIIQMELAEKSISQLDGLMNWFEEGFVTKKKKSGLERLASLQIEARGTVSPFKQDKNKGSVKSRIVAIFAEEKDDESCKKAVAKAKELTQKLQDSTNAFMEQNKESSFAQFIGKELIAKTFPELNTLLDTLSTKENIAQEQQKLEEKRTAKKEHKAARKQEKQILKEQRTVAKQPKTVIEQQPPKKEQVVQQKEVPIAAQQQPMPSVSAPAPAPVNIPPVIPQVQNQQPQSPVTALPTPAIMNQTPQPAPSMQAPQSQQQQPSSQQQQPAPAPIIQKP